PNVTITGNTLICMGQTTTLTANNGASYLWSNSATTNTIAVNPVSLITYSVVGTAASGCTNSASKQVSVNPIPNITITGNTVICLGQITTLTGDSAAFYLWSNSVTTNTNAVGPSSSTIYSVIGTAAVTGCTNSASKQVSVNPLPNVTI